ncbi:MAG: hypothetical protein HFI37_05985 [Lachnospiraceae bacterium]|nr:hypothetical protein [Lachnospiraceae bacterium]
MINPEYTYIGLGSFRRTSGGFQSVAAEFSFVDKMNETKSTLKGNKTQIIEVRSKNLSSDKIQAPSSIKIKKTKTVYIGKKITFPGIMGGKNVTNAISQKSVKWTSSNKSRLTINSKGVIKAKKAGKVTIKAKIGKKTIKKSITVKK